MQLVSKAMFCVGVWKVLIFFQFDQWSYHKYGITYATAHEIQQHSGNSLSLQFTTSFVKSVKSLDEMWLGSRQIAYSSLNVSLNEIGRNIIILIRSPYLYLWSYEDVLKCIRLYWHTIDDCTTHSMKNSNLFPDFSATLVIMFLGIFRPSFIWRDVNGLKSVCGYFFAADLRSNHRAYFHFLRYKHERC